MTKRTRFLIITLAAIAALLPASAASSEPATGPPCAARSQVINTLQSHWAEFPIGRGLSTDGRAIEIYVGPSGSWTIIATTPAGVSCLVVMGEAWERMEWHAAGRLPPP